MRLRAPPSPTRARCSSSRDALVCRVVERVRRDDRRYELPEHVDLHAGALGELGRQRASATFRRTVNPYAALRTRPITRRRDGPPRRRRRSDTPRRRRPACEPSRGARSSSGTLAFATLKPRPASNGVSERVMSAAEVAVALLDPQGVERRVADGSGRRGGHERVPDLHGPRARRRRARSRARRHR